MLRLSEPPFFDHTTLHVMKLLIMQCSPASCHFTPRMSKHSPLHPVLITLILCSCLNGDRDVNYRGLRTTEYNIISFIHNFCLIVILHYWLSLFLCHFLHPVNFYVFSSTFVWETKRQLLTEVVSSAGNPHTKIATFIADIHKVCC
jgi:hypothetical protein